MKDLLFLAFFVLSLASLSHIAAMKFSPDHLALVVGGKYSINCSTKASPANLVIKVDKADKALDVAIPSESQQGGKSMGFILENYKSSSSDNEKEVSFVISPTMAGELKIECGPKDSRVFPVLKSDISSNEKKKSISAVFEFLSLADRDSIANNSRNLTVKMNPPKGISKDSFTSTLKCGNDTDKETSVCLIATTSGKKLPAGQYALELRNADTLITSSSVDVSSDKLEIEACGPIGGSNCIADSEKCTYECRVVGWPFTGCSVNRLEGDTPERLDVKCMLADHAIRFTLNSPKQEDDGLYNVTANGSEKNAPFSEEYQIRVKDKLAPLWPFLGICAEVVILCGVILFFEKRHQRKLQQQEQDEGGATEAMIKQPGKGADVRQRQAAKA